MRWLMTLLLPAFAVCGVRADTFLYVSKAPEKQIQIFRLSSADGKLTEVDTVKVDGIPGAIAVDPQKMYMIVSLRSTASLASFAIDSNTGKIKQLSTAPLEKGADAAFVGTDRTGRWIISASYGAGKVFVHRLKDDGRIDETPVETVTTAKTAHAFATSPDNKMGVRAARGPRMPSINSHSTTSPAN